MSRTIRVLIGLCLLISLLLPVSTASAGKPTPPPTPPPPTLELTPPWLDIIPSAEELNNFGCNLESDVNGSEILFCKPAIPTLTYGIPTLVVFAHGYVNPYFQAKKLPWDQLIFNGPSGPITAYELVTAQGYYFAATSYRANGLVVQDAIQDIRIMLSQVQGRVVSYFFGMKNFILAGASEGGLITALSVERYTDFDGGLAMCGPVGDFQKQINYMGDFRALYDVYYPQMRETYGGDATNIPTQLIKDWYGVNSSTFKVDELNQAVNQLARTKDLLNVAKAPYGPSGGLGQITETDAVRETVSILLDYNINATNNGRSVFGGNPFDNTRTVYSGSTYFNDNFLKTNVDRYSVSRTALKNMPKYQTTGLLKKPLVLLHNTGDPIVPFWHTVLYDSKVPATNQDFSIDPIDRYGHCNFTSDEILTSFGKLGGMISIMNYNTLEPQLSPEQRDAFQKELREKGYMK